MLIIVFEVGDLELLILCKPKNILHIAHCVLKNFMFSDNRVHCVLKTLLNFSDDPCKTYINHIRKLHETQKY